MTGNAIPEPFNASNGL